MLTQLSNWEVVDKQARAFDKMSQKLRNPPALHIVDFHEHKHSYNASFDNNRIKTVGSGIDSARNCYIETETISHGSTRAYGSNKKKIK
jgi:hypothetical protein